MPATPADHPAVAQASTDAELLAALAVDQSSALGALYDRYAGLVYGLAMKVLRAPSEAEDLTQEIFLTLCTKSDYDPARGSLSAFLVTLTRSRAIDKLRARSRKTQFLHRWGEAAITEAPVPSPFADLSIAECSERVQAALAGLPEMQRRVLEMAYYRDLSQSEIAAELDTPLGTVKSWARKGLFSLRESLAALAG
jgi:RNA polymerase sigma-70 factor (ECF subfamily)